MSRPKVHTFPAGGRTLGHQPVLDNAKHSALIHPSVWFKCLSSSGGIAARINPYKPMAHVHPFDAKSHGGSLNTLIPGQAHHILPFRSDPNPK